MNSRSIFNLNVEAVLRRLPDWVGCDLCTVLIIVQLCVDDVPLTAVRSAVAHRRGLAPDTDDPRPFVASVIEFLAEETLREIARNAPALFLAYNGMSHRPIGWAGSDEQSRRIYVLRHLPCGNYAHELITAIIGAIDSLPEANHAPSMVQ